MEEIDDVAKFKANMKELIKASQFKQASEIANIKVESEAFQDLKLREQVTLVHWWTKIYY